MAYDYKTIRDYSCYFYYEDTPPNITCRAYVKNRTKYEKVPTPDELFDVFETAPVDVKYDYLFAYTTACKGFPRIPEGGATYTRALRENPVVVPPAIPKTVDLSYFFYKSSSLCHAAVIPKTAVDLSYMYWGCTSLLWPVSIPAAAENISSLYRYCTKLTGEMIVRPTSFVTKASVFRDTVEPITLYGDQAICETLAATATNANVSWSPWYDPVPAVTNRGQGSRTTAADMTRMVRNGALAVSSYAPGRMVYQTGDIVREDEWNALVEAAQTIDPTVTSSTHYANLNKIEAAFDSAL